MFKGSVPYVNLKISTAKIQIEHADIQDDETLFRFLLSRFSCLHVQAAYSRMGVDRRIT